MSGTEVKNSLRKLDYPACAREAMAKIGHLICGRVPSLKNMDLALDLMAELIFCEVDRRGNKRQNGLAPLVELQLLEVLYDYFSQTSNDSVRNTVFLSLFSGTTAMLRSAILCKLCSIAIGIPCPPVLISTSTWMQQLGNTSINSNQLAKAIVNDYFTLAPGTIPKLKVLPDIAPQFTANFLTAIANMYFSDAKKEAFLYPPESLLEVIMFWIQDNPGLCVAAQQTHLSLPTGAIAMEATTPIAGLLKWCILAPLHNKDKDLYGKLHLGLLNSILEIPVTTSPRAICAQNLTASVSSIIQYLTNTRSKIIKVEQEEEIDDKLQLSLDRFAQAVQVALYRKCVYGNLEDLFNQLLQLPQSRLLHIIINTHKQNK